MHLLKLSLVFLCLYTNIANASALGKRGTCFTLFGGAASCMDSAGLCPVLPSCHSHLLGTYWTCYCPSGYSLVCDACIQT